MQRDNTKSGGRKNKRQLHFDPLNQQKIAQDLGMN